MHEVNTHPSKNFHQCSKFHFQKRACSCALTGLGLFVQVAWIDKLTIKISHTLNECMHAVVVYVIKQYYTPSRRVCMAINSKSSLSVLTIV